MSLASRRVNNSFTRGEFHLDSIDHHLLIGVLFIE